MKKFILISIIAVAAMGMIGCGEDDGTSADLRWINKHGTDVTDIQWMSDSNENQKWSGTFANLAPTNYQGISKLNGSGECIFADGTAGGLPQPIELVDTDPAVEGVAVNGTNSVVISENAAATLVIGAIGK